MTRVQFPVAEAPPHPRAHTPACVPARSGVHAQRAKGVAVQRLHLGASPRAHPDPPRTRTWNLRLRRPTPYPLGQRTCGFDFRARERKPFASCYSVMSACAGILMLLPERSSWQQIAAASCECSRLFHCLPLLLCTHLIRPGLEPGISSSGDRRLIH